jgi:two-component system chemotaxis response regulator CheB
MGSALSCIVIGISTGGPQALSQVLPLLSPPLPPILIVQHMPAKFTSVFAERLNRSCKVPVKEAEDNELVTPNRIYIAPGGMHMSLMGRAQQTRISLSDGPVVSGHRPSVDVLFTSAARIFQKGIVGCIMTGMGRDGVAGCKAILQAGGWTFGQDEETSVVYGMNKAAYLEHAVREQFSLSELPGIMKKLTTTRNRGNRDSTPMN